MSSGFDSEPRGCPQGHQLRSYLTVCQARRSNAQMPGPHDLGGADFGPIKRDEHERSDREKRIDAMQYTLRDRGYWRVDEMRRAIESLPPQDYLTFTYYQKWLSALHMLVKRKGAS